MLSDRELKNTNTKDDFKNLSEPIGGENDDKANNSCSDALFARFGFFGVGSSGEHGETTGNEHGKEDEAGYGKEVGEEGVDDGANICELIS